MLHTRISEQLAEDIREFAEDLRVPASNLVRNVLEEVFTMVDSVSGDVGHLMDDLVEEAEGVSERIRRQARSDRSRRRRRGGHRRRERGVRDEDVEAEFRRDEARESAGDRGRRPAGSSTAAASEAEPDSPLRPPASELFPDILGWQPLVLNRDAACGRCERSLHAGESAFLGMTPGGLTATSLCGPCAASSSEAGSSERGR